MSPMLIDFSGRSRLRQPGLASRGELLWGVLAGIAFLALLAGVGLLSYSQQQVGALRTQLQSVEAAQQQALPVEEDTELAIDERVGINNAVRHLNYPWLDIFEGMEKSLYPEVAIVSVELGPARQGVKVVFDATGINEALTFMESLGEQPRLRGMSLLRQENAGSDGGQRAMRFTIESRATDAQQVRGNAR